MAYLVLPPSSFRKERVTDIAWPKANKREWRRRLVAIADALGAPRPKQAADDLMLLLEPAYAVSRALGAPDGPASEIVGATETI
jgi:hypothetical protein